MALETAVNQFHRWDDMVFRGLDGCPPLVNVQLSAYTMDFFMREKELLQLLFASKPEFADITNTNIATILYEGSKLRGIAIEYGDDKRAYVAMDKLDRSQFVLGMPDWQSHPEAHGDEMRRRIKALTGHSIGLVKCADLNGFFGGLHRVVENPNLLEMLLEGVKFAANAVSCGYLSIDPEPKFFSYLRLLNPLTDTMVPSERARKINTRLPEFSMGLVLQNREKQFAAVEIYAKAPQKDETQKGKLGFKDFGDASICEGLPLKTVTASLRENAKETFAVGLSTSFLYDAMHAALTYSPYQLGKAVFNAVRNEEIVVC